LWIDGAADAAVVIQPRVEPTCKETKRANSRFAVGMI